MSLTRRRRLSSDAWRHAVTMAAQILFVLGLLAWWWPQDRVRRAVLSLSLSLASLAVYGVLYLALTWLGLRGLRGEVLRDELRRSATPRTAGMRLLVGLGPRTWAVSLALMSLAGVWVVIVVGRLQASPALWVSGVVGVLGTWVLLLGVFATEYARQWAEHGAFRFPDDDAGRTFGDFLYLSAQLSTTFSSSDVEVVSGPARASVTVHSLAAWLYTTVIIAVLVSVALGA